MPEQKMCSRNGCDKEARVGIRTTRPSRADLKTMVYWDERVAPATADLLCKEHGVATLTSLANTLIDEG